MPPISLETLNFLESLPTTPDGRVILLHATPIVGQMLVELETKGHLVRDGENYKLSEAERARRKSKDHEHRRKAALEALHRDPTNWVGKVVSSFLSHSPGAVFSAPEGQHIDVVRDGSCQNIDNDIVMRLNMTDGTKYMLAVRRLSNGDDDLPADFLSTTGGDS